MWFYNFGLILYVWAIRLVAPRHPKARLWIEGRKDLFRRMREAIAPTDRIIWIHVASLGEFEQGRPIIEQLRKTHPEYKILLTFFSPSGYEIRKNYKGVDYIFYLPIDTPGNARRFLDAAHPEIAIFVKYEYWLNLLRELRRRKIRTYVVSAIFRRNSVFFRPYGGMWRQALESFDVMFVQNEESKKLLATLGFDNVLVAGDTRFDRVAEIARAARRIDVIDRSTVTHIDTGVNMGALVHYTSAKDGGSTEHIAEGEFVLVAIGRDPLTSDGWIRDAGVTVDDHGFITTDGYGRTTVAGIWAVGDITEGHALAHRAFEQGIIAAESIAGLDPKPLDEDTIPQIVFSNPEAASVGLTATDAKQRNDLSDIKETVYPMMSNARMMMSGSGGSLSLVSGIRAQQPGVRVVLGVHMVAPVASDIIAEAEQLVGNHTPLSDAARLIHPHPTFSETLGETLLKADDRPLHTR
mgnify:CR=1 FL=1